MIKFGTGGWRAVIGDDFICENIRRVAAGVLELAKEQNKTDKPVIIGYDRRFLSVSAAKWVAEVLAEGGIEVWFLNRSAPTPLIMHTVKDKNLYFGIEITASHNPANYNGIKLFVEEGRDASLEVTHRLEEIIENISSPAYIEFDEAVESGKIVYQRNPFNKFLDDIIDLLDMDALRERGLRVLFDAMHGSGSYPLEVILHTARCTIDTINLNKDAFFGGQMPAPTEKTLATLSNLVIVGDYDFGIAMDGDGDRLGIVDKFGHYINANEILCMLYYYLVKHKGWKGPVVRNLATTHLLDKIAESFGEVCYEVPVGFKYISSKLDEVDAVLGGESSGGLTVRGHIYGKDSVYAAALFSEMVSVTGKSPTEILEEIKEIYGSYVMVEDNLCFAPERKEEINKIIMIDKLLPDFGKNIVRVNYEDGCKVYFEDDSFVICRFSGTEPLLRIFAESSDGIDAKKYIADFRDFLKI
ncbi:MAG: phosphoglucomutase/phosphomannomutase family protein [Acutalibacteraceae bacterium]|nr:phosphoglucomutase/phosphomannomutase family protein [Acutalibacteraceae bacterium]